jgi:hypothetical protein
MKVVKSIRVQGAMVKVDEVATPRALPVASMATTMTVQAEERRAGTSQKKGETAVVVPTADSQDRPPSTE